MFLLEKKDYSKVLPLIKSDHNLSVFSVIYGVMPGMVLVNDIVSPAAALVRTSECNLTAGDPSDKRFNASIGEMLDFWSQVTPDTDEWIDVIPVFHKNRFIRKYTRRHYILDTQRFTYTPAKLPDGYVLEQAIPSQVREHNYQYAGNIHNLIEDWGGDDNYLKYGGGVYTRLKDEIVSWSPCDCSYLDKAEIGIHTTEKYRKQGFAAATAAENIRICINKGHRQIGWHCVDMNKGSAAVAGKLGFELDKKYVSFTSYTPIENPKDLSEDEWNEWAEYYENAIKTEPLLWSECLSAYIKANNIVKANEVLAVHKRDKPFEHNFNEMIRHLHTIGMAADLPDNWIL